MKKQLLFAFGAAALLASCSNDIDNPSAVNDGYLRVNGTINEIKTRATDTSFESDDVIGVTIDGGSTYSAYKFNGTSFDFDGEGDGIKVASNLTVSAYFPYPGNVTDKEISFNVASQTGVDFLFASGSVTPENPNVNFTFNHKMSKLVFTFQDVDNQFTNDETFELSLSNVATTGKFNISTGDVTADAANGSLSSVVTLGSAKSFIVPSYATDNTAPISVVVTVSNGDSYLASVTPKLAAGTQYNYTLNIKKDTPNMNVGGGGINGWEQENDDIDAEKGEKPYQLAVGDFLLKDGTTIVPNADDEKITIENPVVGVVYYVGNPQPSALYPSKEYGEIDVLKQDFQNCTHGLAIALENGNDNQSIRFATGKYNFTTWDGKDSYINTNLSITSFPEEWLGYNNTQVIKKATEALSSSETQTGCQQVIDFLNSYSEKYPVSNASTWYLPSYGEFAEIIENLDVIQGSLGLLGKALDEYESFDPTINTNSDCFYWTSDFRSQDYTWVTPLVKHEKLDKGYYAPRATSGDKGFFRFAIAF